MSFRCLIIICISKMRYLLVRPVYLICMDRETANVDKTEEQTDNHPILPPPILKHSSAQLSPIRSNSASSSNKGTGHSYEVLHLIIQATPCRLPYTSHSIPSLSCPLLPFPFLPFPFLPKIRQAAKERKKERTTTTLRSLTHSLTSNILSPPTHQHNYYSSAQEKELSTKRGVVSLRNSNPPFLALDIVRNNQGETPTPILPATASTPTPTSSHFLPLPSQPHSSRVVGSNRQRKPSGLCFSKKQYGTRELELVLA